MTHQSETWLGKIIWPVEGLFSFVPPVRAEPLNRGHLHFALGHFLEMVSTCFSIRCHYNATSNCSEPFKGEFDVGHLFEVWWRVIPPVHKPSPESLNRVMISIRSFCDVGHRSPKAFQKLFFNCSAPRCSGMKRTVALLMLVTDFGWIAVRSMTLSTCHVCTGSTEDDAS